jgi:hypothetical protein
MRVKYTQPKVIMNKEMEPRQTFGSISMHHITSTNPDQEQRCVATQNSDHDSMRNSQTFFS